MLYQIVHNTPFSALACLSIVNTEYNETVVTRAVPVTALSPFLNTVRASQSLAVLTALSSAGRRCSPRPYLSIGARIRPGNATHNGWRTGIRSYYSSIKIGDLIAPGPIK